MNGAFECSAMRPGKDDLRRMHHADIMPSPRCRALPLRVDQRAMRCAVPRWLCLNRLQKTHGLTTPQAFEE